MSPALNEFMQVIVLAVVQGLGEFLPISSSGHVLVLAHLFEAFGHQLQQKLTVNVMLHLGTLLAVIVFYRRQILQVLRNEHRTVFLLLLGTVPAGVIGVGYELWLRDWLVVQAGFDPLDHLLTTGLMFAMTGVVLLLVGRLEGTKTAQGLTSVDALLIGLAQAAAILPGLSRSGMTIAAGLACGLKREEAASFSFLLSIPVIAGAGLIEGRKLFGAGGTDAPLGPLLIGVVVSFLVGLVALRWLLRWLIKGRLGWFAGWVFAMALLLLGWQLSAAL